VVYFKTLPQHFFSEGLRKPRKASSKTDGLGADPRPPKHEVTVLNTRPRRWVGLRKNIRSLMNFVDNRQTKMMNVKEVHFNMEYNE
jgi:hypothetical protein